MNKVITYVKSHPWMIGGLVVGCVLVFVLVRSMMSGGGGGTTVVQAAQGPSEEAQLAYAQLQASQSIANISAATDLQKTGIMAELEKFLGTAQKDVALAQIKSESDLNTSAANATLAQIMAQRDVSLADIGASLNMFTIQNQTSKDIAALQASIVSNADKYDYLLGSQQLTSNETILTKVMDALKPKPAPEPTRFDPFNTSNPSQPLLQGFDVAIAQKIDQGQVFVDAGGNITIPGDEDSSAGSYQATNVLDTRWMDYIPGSYTATGSVNFH